jgi:hypothetical protein
MEDSMRKLLTGFAAVSALAFLASAAQADCFDGHVSASAPSEEKIAMSTNDGTQPTVEEEKAEAAATTCPEGATDCAPAGE